MKIVQVGGALNGAQKIIEEAIHHRALEMGHESYIFYARGKSDEPGLIKYESKFENLATRALRKYGGKRSCYSALQTRRLIQEIQRINPDIIHLHVLHHGYTDYQMLFKYLVKAQIPVVYTMHDMWAFTGGCYHYTALGCTGYQTGCNYCIAGKNQLDTEKAAVGSSYSRKKSMFSQLNRVHFVPVSWWVKEEMLKSFLAKYPISVIPNGVAVNDNLALRHRAPREDKGKIRLISVAATWTEKKGINVLLELAQRLGEGYELWLAGSVAEDVKIHAPANVKFLGYCRDKKQLFEYYAACDLYVGASQEETFGMTFVEAALAGIRSVGFASTAITGTLHEIGGVGVKEFTCEALVRAIVRVMESRRNALSLIEIEEVANKFSPQHMADQYLNIYHEITK